MDMNNSFEVNSPIGETWEVLTDVGQIAPCLPGASLTGVSGSQYQGLVKIKVGPITAQYRGTAEFVERDDQAHRAVISAKGRDTRGAGNASAVITAQLHEVDADTTRVDVRTKLTITGRVAQFGRGVMADVSAKLMAQFADNLADLIASGPPLVYAAIKEIVREAEDMKFHDAMNRITKSQFATVETLYRSEDQKEGARAFAEKRDPVWKGR